MKSQIMVLSLIVFILLSGCNDPDNFEFELKKQNESDAHKIRVEFINDQIVHVTAIPDEDFQNPKSLMIINQNNAETKIRKVESNNEVELSSDKLSLKINKDLGTISYYNKNGKLLLSEKEGGSKIFTKANIMGEQTHHAQQLFTKNPGEGFYGLGAHQNGQFNYSGNDVDLWQYNCVNAVPFLVSSSNYGLLWDNNSRTKFGDARDYVSISSLTLLNAEGKEGGLTAEYFKDKNFRVLFTKRNENRIEHEYLDINDEYPDGFTENVAAVRWSGKVISNKTGPHKFRLYSSGYTKMWLNGELVVDSWRQNWMPWTHLPKLNMEAGREYNIKIEWIHSGGYIGLKYLTPQNEIYDNNISLFSEVADQIDYYFISGDDLDEVIKGYRTLTGKAPMMPKWAMGLWQCRERYKSQDELLGVVEEFRKRGIPLDNIVQDWFYWEEDKWGDHEFDPQRYPDPEKMIDSLHNSLNTNLMISVWPKYYVGTENYELLNSKGLLYTRNVEKKERDWVGPGYISTFYDPYSDEAQKLFWKGLNDKLFSKGIDAWWLDATEPDIHSNLSPQELRLRISPTAFGTSARYLNTYSLMNSKGVYEGQLKSDPDKRVFILTRSAFAGQQRYSAATWSGDIASRWYDLKNQIPAGLNFSLSGIPYWTHDIGGFAVEPRFENPNKADLEEWRELNARWFQFGAFSPLFRVHGQFPYREMFNIAPDDHPAFQSMLKYAKLRYRLMPYIYSLTGMVTHKDYTIMRALVMDYNQDKNVFSIGDQYMFGPSMLINPVTDYKARTRQVYLPNGNGWYELREGNYFQGGQTITADAPYEDLPIYIKEGSIIPFGPEITYTTEKPADPIRLIIFTGRDAEFTIYEDENINNNYKKGNFTNIKIEYNENKKELTMHPQSGEFDGMRSIRIFEIQWLTPEKAVRFDLNSDPDKIVEYSGSKLTVKLED